VQILAQAKENYRQQAIKYKK